MTAVQDVIQDLNQQFGVPRKLWFDRDQAGMVFGSIETISCRGRFYLHGAHVTRYQPAGFEDLLFVSREAVYRPDKAIRGGVPICFPWFGSHPSDPKLPAHGWARVQEWELVGRSVSDNRVQVDLITRKDGIEVRCQLDFAETLGLTLTASNPGNKERRCEAALHAYFAVSDIERISVKGLDQATFVDQLTGKTHPAALDPIRFSRETDRIYQGTGDTILIEDPDRRRRIVIEKIGSMSTVVWNPWIEKAARLADFGNDEWKKMVCIETACIRPHDFLLPPGAEYCMGARHRVESMPAG